MGTLLVGILSRVIQLYIFVVLLNAILSWFVYGSRNMTVRKIYWVTSQFVDPALDPIRRILNPMTRSFGIDISPFILILFLQVLHEMLRSALM